MAQTLGKRIKAIRESLEMNQEHLANSIGLDRASLSQIENDKRSVKAEELAKISKTLNVSVDHLLDLSSAPIIQIEQNRSKLKGTKPALRISVPASNSQKFKEVLLYILSKVGAKPNVGETVLYKLLYFIDFNYYEKYEEQLIGATYIKNHHGPTPIEFHAIIKQMIKHKELEQVKSNYFQHPQKKYLPHRKPNLSLLSAIEIKLIDEVLDKLSDMNAATISEYSHLDVPWIVTENQEKIDYEAVFYRTPNYSVREYSNDSLS